MDIIFEAIQFANKKHEGQVRRVSLEPYINHPIAVSYLLVSYKQRSKNLSKLICAALLHDTLEDTDATFEELVEKFGPLVASLVLELTSCEEEIKKIGKNQYLKIKMVGMSSYALTLKLVDRLSNLMDNPGEKYLVNTRDLMLHIGKHRKLSKTQKAIIKDIILRIDFLQQPIDSL